MICNRETNISMKNLGKKKVEIKVKSKIIWMMMMR
jgi:hypothetical protein